MTWRLVKVLIDGLPPESLTKTAIRDGLTDEQFAEAAKAEHQGHGPWSHPEMLIAAAVDMLAQIRHVLVVANGGKAQPPQPIPRPGVKRAAPRRLTAAGAAHLSALAQRHEQVRKEAGLG